VAICDADDADRIASFFFATGTSGAGQLGVRHQSTGLYPNRAGDLRASVLRIVATLQPTAGPPEQVACDLPGPRVVPVELSWMKANARLEEVS